MSIRSHTRPHSRTRPRVTRGEGFLSSLIDPIDRLAETIFSILILLTFTLAFRIIRVTEAGAPPAPVSTNELLIGALGAILAWGVIDGIMYAMLGLFERGEDLRLMINVQNAASDEEALQYVAHDLDYLIEPYADESSRLAYYQNIVAHQRSQEPPKIGFEKDDLTGALAHVIIAIIAVLPSLAPLLLLPNDPGLAIRISNIISFIVLFVSGFQWGQYTGVNPWKTGLLLAGLAAVMVLVAIPLGG